MDLDGMRNEEEGKVLKSERRLDVVGRSGRGPVQRQANIRFDTAATQMMGVQIVKRELGDWGGEVTSEGVAQEHLEHLEHTQVEHARRRRVRLMGCLKVERAYLVGSANRLGAPG